MIQIAKGLRGVEAVFQSVTILSNDLKLLNCGIVAHVIGIFMLNDLDVTSIFFITSVGRIIDKVVVCASSNSAEKQGMSLQSNVTRAPELSRIKTRVTEAASNCSYKKLLVLTHRDLVQRCPHPNLISIIDMIQVKAAIYLMIFEDLN